MYNNTGFVSSTQPIIARTNQYDEQQQRASKKYYVVRLDQKERS